MKSRSRILSALMPVAVLVLMLAIVGFSLNEFQRRISSSMTIVDAKRPYRFSGSFLAEGEALDIARDTFQLSGLDKNEWHIREDDRSKAPDGTPDRYVVRNTIDPNSVGLVFEGPNHRELFFNLHHEADRYQVYLSFGK